MSVLLLLGVSLLAQQTTMDRPRLASQAQSLIEQLPNLVTTETMHQKAVTYKNRMRIRLGQSALKPIPPTVEQREIRSELGYGLRGKETPVWSEVRKVVTVDGKRVMAPKKARERLVFGLKSDDERERLKMMEEFRGYGLENLATDYGLSLLMFRSGDIDKVNFEYKTTEFVGAESVAVFTFARKDDAVAVTIYDPKQVVRQPIRGTIAVRVSDLRPIRIQVVSDLMQDQTRIVDEGTVEYAPSKFGCVTPRHVVHTRRINGILMTETHYTYEEFQKFGAETELKFTP